MRINVLIWAKTRNGKRLVDVDGNHFSIKKIFKGNNTCFVSVISVKNKNEIMIDVEGNKDLSVKFQ